MESKLEVVATPENCRAVREQAMDALPPEAQKIVPKLKTLLTNVDKVLLKTWFEMGKVVETKFQEVQPQLEQAAKRPWGEGIVEKLALAAGMPPRMLYHARRLYQNVGPEELDAWIAADLSVSHAIHLSGLKERADRERYLAELQSNDRTATELGRQIGHDTPKLPRGPGRSPSVPKAAAEGIRTATARCTEFVNRVKKAWFSEQFNIAEVIIAGTPPDKFSPEFLADVQVLRSLFAEAATLLQAGASQVGEAENWVAQCLKMQAEHSVSSEVPAV